MKFAFRICLGLLTCCLSGIIVAQEIGREVVATSGDRHDNGTINMEWTLGEVMVESYNTGGLKWTQGFHQPEIQVIGINDHSGNVSSTAISIYPNPFNEYINFKVEDDLTVYSFRLYDMQGKLLLKQQAETGQRSGQIFLGAYTTGTYLLKIEYQQGQQFSLHSIIKK